ncbi:MAG: hypothetical protein OES09_00060 [Gammaproteobacteria bacterium]|nr:hypothetical protein [Gammaproteobacteria bacterium]
MSHVRQQIRDRVAQILTGLTTTGTSVTASRVLPYDVVDLPALALKIETEEPVEETLTDDDHMTVDMVLVIMARASGTSLVNTLDTIQSEVQTAMAGEPKLNGLASSVEWAGVTDDELEDEGQVQIGTREIRYRLITSYSLRDPTGVVA